MREDRSAGPAAPAARRGAAWKLMAALSLGLAVTAGEWWFADVLEPVDRAILVGVAKARSAWATNVAINLTALGSVTLVTLFTLIGLGVFTVRRAREEAVQLLTSTTGALLAQLLGKRVIAHERPSAVPHLVEATGFTYPSGHALSFTALAVTLSIVLRRRAESEAARRAVAVVAAALVAAVAFSRIYLGVHHARDVLGGAALGAAWALLVDSAVARRRARA